MQTAAELDLTFLPIEEDAFARDPFPYFADARKQHPWLTKCSVGYMFTEWAAIRASRTIETSWSDWAGLPDQATLWDYVRNVKVVKRQ